MHLDHKIPWNALSTHLILIKSNKSYTPHRSDIFWTSHTGSPLTASQKSTIKKAQDHFCRVFISTLRDFATTKLESHARGVEPPASEPLFSEDLIAYAERRFELLPHEQNSATHNPLSDEMKEMKYWVKAARSPEDLDSSPMYTTSNADLGDAVKFLITLAATASTAEEKYFAAQAFSAVLRLNNHPEIPLRCLDSLHWGHGFGVSLLAHFTLQIYMTINLYDSIAEPKLSAQNQRRKPQMSLLEVDSLIHVLGSDALAGYDYSAQNILHRRFWNSLRVTEEYMQKQERAKEDLTQLPKNTDLDIKDPTSGNIDDGTRQRLKEYLKTCFAVLYIYDMLLRSWYGVEKADRF